MSFLLSLFFPVLVLAVPNSLSYQGRIVRPDGTAFEINNVSFVFEITNPAGNCVIYREQKSGVDMTNSNGVFDVPIGTGSKLFPPSPTKTLLSVFDNSQALDCGNASNNIVSSYTPALTHSRLLRVQFHDGTGWQIITPDTEIRSVPYAAYASGADTAQSLGGKTASDFVLKTSIPTCAANSFLSWNGSILSCTSISSLTMAGDVSGSSTATSVDKIKGINVDATAPTTGQVLKFDGTKWSPATISAGGSGTVTSVTGTSGQITVSNGTTTPVIALDTVGTAGTYYKITTDSHGRVTSGVATLSASDIPSLDYSKITSGTPTTLSGYNITDAVRNQGGTPGIKSGLNTSKGTAGTSGNLYVSTDTKEIYRDNGSTWDLLGSSASGTITGVTAGTGLSGGGTSGSVTLNVDVGVGANKIVQLDSSSKLPAVDGSALTNLNPSALSTVLPISKGGTGQSSVTAGFNALSPVSAKGDLITRDSANNIRLPVGTDGQVLSADSTQGAGLKWITPTAGTVTNVTASAPLSVATGGTTPALSISSGTGDAQVLRWNTTNWSSSYLNFADLKSAAGLTQIPNNCTASQTLVWQTPADTFSCVDISVTGSNFAAQSAGLVFAGPTTGSSTPAFRALAFSDLPSGTLSGSGTSGYIPYYSTATTQTNSALYTSGGNIGIGTTSPATSLDVNGAIKVGTTTCDASKAGAIGYNSALGQIQVCINGAWQNVGNGAPVPPNSDIVMKACPSGWTDIVMTNGPAMNVNGSTGHVCRSPSTPSLIPASTIMPMFNCPSGWTQLGTVTPTVFAASSIAVCQSPATDDVLPSGSHVVGASGTCPANWKYLNGINSNCNGSCRICESPGGLTFPRMVHGGLATSASSNGANAFIRGGNGGTTSGAGGIVSINGGIPTEGSGGGITLTGASGASLVTAAQAGGTISIRAGNGVNGGTGGTVLIQTGWDGVNANSYSDLTLQASGGNVGIGTLDPAAPLHIHTGANSNLMIYGAQLTSTGIKFNSTDDSNTVSKEMEFQASSFNFSGGNVQVSTALQIGNSAPLGRITVCSYTNTNFNLSVGGPEFVVNWTTGNCTNGYPNTTCIGTVSKHVISGFENNIAVLVPNEKPSVLSSLTAGANGGFGFNTDATNSNGFVDFKAVYQCEN
ncbi:beta strand repeat-containing protein [Bdellovibrio sp. HCB209]|uniref:beta strand repeat-containing protein n=1 Tax=Bdellovibrio sp. HCB209 TaxID=3394354 RepID=UPI0039B606CC